MNELDIWRNVPNVAIQLADLSRETYQFWKESDHKLPKTTTNYDKVFYDPFDRILFFNTGPVIDVEKIASYKSILEKAPNVDFIEFDTVAIPTVKHGSSYWVPFNSFSVKQAVINPSLKPDNELKNIETPPNVVNKGTEPFSTIAELAGYKPGITTRILGGPNTLSSTIGSGILGGATGYLTGTALENLFPEKYVRKNRMRNVLGLAGAGLAAAPALWAGYAKKSCDQKALEYLDKLIPQECQTVNSSFEKISGILYSTDFHPTIHADAFNRVLFNPEDQFSPPELRAAAAGLVSGSSSIKGSPYVSASDIANVAVNAGGGYLAGLAGGRILSALAGVTPPVQEKLQQTGMWFGALRGIVPIFKR